MQLVEQKQGKLKVNKDEMRIMKNIQKILLGSNQTSLYKNSPSIKAEL